VLSDTDLATLRSHGIAIFRDRVILQAQPPITPAQLTAVERKLTGPVPPSLLALWQITFGGRLDYDLAITFGEHQYSASFRELFYPGSDGYHDLPGWIEDELALAREAAEARGEEAPEKLDLVPFGGFEYLERVYVSVRPDEVGRVYLWAKGLPPSWKMDLNQDSVAAIAGNVAGLFDQLGLDENPFSPSADPTRVVGIEMVEAVDELRQKNARLADELQSVIVASVFDWRSVIAGGPFEDTPPQRRAQRIALADVALRDDVEMVELLLRHRYPVDPPVSGNNRVLSLALVHRAHRVAEALLAADVPLGDTVIVFAQGASEALIDKLVARGVTFDIEAVISSASSGELAAARRIVERGKPTGTSAGVRKVALDRAKQAEQNAEQIEAKKLHTNVTAEEYRLQAQRLRKLVDAVGGR
jgi:hypothetical protein